MTDKEAGVANQTVNCPLGREEGTKKGLVGDRRYRLWGMGRSGGCHFGQWKFPAHECQGESKEYYLYKELVIGQMGERKSCLSL